MTALSAQRPEARDMELASTQDRPPRSGLPLSLPASRCSRQGKCLPNFFAPLTPPLAAVARNPPQIAVDDTCYPKNESECSP